MIFWTAEEFGHLGSRYYYERHKSWTNESFFFVSESDEGVFRPRSLNSTVQFSGSEEFLKTVSAIAALIRAARIPVSVRRTNAAELGDVRYWAQDGVPGFFYLNYDYLDHYFIFHHTNADTMTVLKAEDLDYTSAIFGSFAYVIANMDSVGLPLRTNRPYTKSN